MSRFLGNSDSFNNFLMDKSTSFVLSSSKGTGKYTAALIKAKQILCLTQKENCTCDSCVKFDLNCHPDLIIRDKVSKEEIEDISFSEKSSVSDKRVFIFDNFNETSVSVSNYLLKIIEDGPVDNIFIIINNGKVLNTVLSRSVEYTFTSSSYKEFKDFFKELDEETLKFLYNVTAGAFGRAINLLPRVSELFNRFKEIADCINRRDLKGYLEKLMIIKIKADTKDILGIEEEFKTALVLLLTEVVLFDKLGYSPIFKVDGSGMGNKVSLNSILKLKETKEFNVDSFSFTTKLFN